MPRAPTLTATGLRLTLGGVLALGGVDLAASPREVVAIVGPNGAGKTSLLEVLAGLRRPDSGELRFEGRPLRGLADHARVFSYMPNDPLPAAELTARDVIEHARASACVDRALAGELAERLSLSALRRARMNELSCGERKRVSLFAAMCSRRPVLLLDEPFGAFDPLDLRGILATVRDQANSGRMVLTSIHQLADAEKIADRILLLHAGRVAAVGSLDELRHELGAPGASLEDLFLRALQRAPTGAASASPSAA